MVVVRVTETPGLGPKEVSEGQVTGRLPINRLVDHLEISFSIKGGAGVILQKVQE